MRKIKSRRRNPEWHPIGIKQIGELQKPVLVVHPGDTNLPIDIVEESLAIRENNRVKSLGGEPALVLSKDQYMFFRSLRDQLNYYAYNKVKKGISSGHLELDELLFKKD